MTPTPAEWLRATLADGAWHRVGDLSIAARTEGFTPGDLSAAWDALADDLDWNTANPPRVRLTPRALATPQLTLEAR